MPVIGVPIRYGEDDGVSTLYIFESVRRTLQQAGAEVFLILPVQDVDFMKTPNEDFPLLTDDEKRKVNSYLNKCDGLFLPGGSKFTPYDRYILEYAVERDIPTLGVCLSMQMMSCYKEDVELVLNDTDISHNVSTGEVCHSVTILKNSKLYNILKKDKIDVNSIHNYHAVDNHIYKSVAWSDDGIIEAIEHPDATFNIGVQWHPEKNYLSDENSKLIIDSFLEEARKYHSEGVDKIVKIK